MFRGERGLSTGAKLAIGIIIVVFGLGFLAVAGFFGLVFFAAGSGSSGGGMTSGAAATPTPAAAPAATPTATSTPASTAQATTHDIGDTFTVGSGGQAIQYRVTDMKKRQTLGSGVLAEEADGVFVVVAIEMTNQADESVSISSNLFTLVDDQDREYDTDSDATVAVENNVVFEQLDPGVEKSGVLIFDVPTDQTGRKLQIDPAGMFSTADSHNVTLG